MFATVSWITHGDGNWSTGSNWSTGTVPQASDNVVIDVPGINLTVTYNGGGRLSLNNLINDERLIIAGGGAAWTGGVWDGSGVVKVNTSLAISGSTDKIMRDGLGIENFGLTTLSGTGNIVGQIGASITNYPTATFNVQSDASITFPTGVGDGIFENGGTFIKSGGGTAPGNMTEIGGAQGFRFENSINALLDPTVNIPGDCQVQQGTLDLGDNQNIANTYGGTFEVSSGATLEYDKGQANIVVLRPMAGPNIIPSITGAGRLDISGGTLQFYGTLTIHEVDVSAGGLLLQQNMTDFGGTPQRNTTPTPTAFGTADILRITGGTFGGNGGGIFSVPAPILHEEEPALVVGNTFDWQGGTLSGTGRLAIDVTATNSVISTTAPKAIVGGFGVDILDETVWRDSGTITMNGNSVLYMHQGGTLWDQNDGTITQGTLDANGGAIWNTGVVLKSGGIGTTVFGPGINVFNDVNVLNFVTATNPILQYPDTGGAAGLLAKIDIRTGTVSMQGTSLNRSNILIHTGATLSYDAGTHLNEAYIDSNDVVNASILGVGGGGTINFGNATFNSDLNALVDVPTAHFGTGTYTFDNAAPGAQVVGVSTFDGGGAGIIGGLGTIEVQTSFLWNTGSFTGSGAATSSLLIDPGAILTIPSGGRSTTNSYSVDNRGTIEWTTSPGILSINGNYNQAATGVLISTIETGTLLLDSLAVTGNVTLGGTLSLNIVTPPVDGQVFTLLNNIGVAPVVGTFAGLAEGGLITIGAKAYTVSYVGGTGNDVTLTCAVLQNITLLTPAPIVVPTAGTASLIFTVLLPAAVLHSVTVTYTTSNGTAIAGVDYTATSGTLVIPAGQASGLIAVPIIGTLAVKPNQTFAITLSNPLGGFLGTPSSAVGTILNENGPPIFIFGSTTYSVDKTAGTTTITVMRTHRPMAPVTVDYSTTPGTATPNVNYTPVSGTLQFAANVTSLTFQVPIIDDHINDANATFNGALTFNVALSNPLGDSATIGTPTAVVTVVQSIAVSVSNASAVISPSSTTSLIFMVTVPANPATVSVNYATADGTALAGVGYVSTVGTLTFTPGQTSQAVPVTLLPNTAIGSNQTLTLNLSNPINALIGVAQGIGTLINQNLPLVSIAGASEMEPLGGQVDATFTISLNTPFTSPVTVQYSTADRTGTAGTTYAAKSGTVTLQPGQISAQIQVPVDTSFSKDATNDFTVTLSNPVGANLGTAIGIGTVVNLPVNTVTFSAAHSFHYVGAAGDRVTVGLNGPGNGTLYYLGLLINDAKEIILDNTTATSQFFIRTSEPQAFLENLIVNGSIKSILAPTTSLQGNLNITGAAQRINLGSLLGGNLLNIGAPSGSLASVSATFVNVTNATFTSAMPIAVLRVANWQNTITGVGISAPSAALITAAGNFAANVSLDMDLGSLRVGRLLSNSTISVGGNIDLVSAGAISNSTIFAGVTAGLDTLPLSTSQFVNSTSTIRRVNVLSAFSSSEIAAPLIGNIALGTIEVANGGVIFGVAGTSIQSIKGIGTRRIKLTNTNVLSSPFTDEDLVVRRTL